jgi:exodeoxyribonuclease V alpha subunit
VAPTGKAAATLASSINSAVSTLPCGDEIKAAIPTVAHTIHRCLGVRVGALTGFRHHAANPLPVDLLLVDEASMVDLALMTRLLSAVPSGARVILLGDEHQLASVETGAVLGDICAVGLSKTPEASAAEANIGDCIARLTHSYRYDPGSGIGALARAINGGDVAGALEVLDSPEHPEVMRFDPGTRGASVAQLQRDVIHGFGGYLKDHDPSQMLASFSNFRVLSPLRRGPGGVEELNRSIESMLRREKLIGSASTRYPGRPLLITTNDYAEGLFNGDVGIVLAGEDGVERVVLGSEDGATRQIAYSRLPDHETAFAMTVHKSQGSEFEQVAIVLTDYAAERASRELLYTAVTRARSKVSLYASKDAIAQTIARRVERASGLGDALRFPAGCSVLAVRN